MRGPIDPTSKNVSSPVLPPTGTRKEPVMTVGKGAPTLFYSRRLSKRQGQDRRDTSLGPNLNRRLQKPAMPHGPGVPGWQAASPAGRGRRTMLLFPTARGEGRAGVRATHRTPLWLFSRPRPVKVPGPWESSPPDLSPTRQPGPCT